MLNILGFKKACSMAWTIFFLLVIFNSTFSFAQTEETPEITAIKPVVGLTGDILVIEGKNFGENKSDSYVEFIDSEATYKAKIEEKDEEWIDNKVMVKVPSHIKREIVKVRIVLGGRISNQKDFGVYPINLIEESIELKKSGVSDSTIVDHLYHLGEGEKNEKTFGNIKLTNGEIKKLKEAGFQDDFIAKFEGHPQHVTLGVAAIWLTETTDLTYAPMIRIFLEPRSYFKKRRDYWKDVYWGLYLPHGLIQYDRWDLNFGVTTLTSTDDSSEQKNYVLIGLSHEINRSALLNIGGAILPGDIKGKQSQVYFGITVDYNFLKYLGIVDK